MDKQNRRDALAGLGMVTMFGGVALLPSSRFGFGLLGIGAVVILGLLVAAILARP